MNFFKLNVISKEVLRVVMFAMLNSNEVLFPPFYIYLTMFIDQKSSFVFSSLKKPIDEYRDL